MMKHQTIIELGLKVSDMIFSQHVELGFWATGFPPRDVQLQMVQKKNSPIILKMFKTCTSNDGSNRTDDNDVKLV